ncbi:MAG: tripartite tricarboxylate transporter substrate-binding protein [Bosea sp. (in: a-proteobacteria)]
MTPSRLTRRTANALFAAVSLASLSSTQLMAQAWPAKPITLVVPFAAGGPSDVIARLLGVKMGERLGQQIIIENIAGAGGTVAAARVSKAEPDGYTLLIHHVALPLGAALYKNLAYDTATAFETLGLVNYGPYVVTTRLGFDANTPKQLFDTLKANSDKVTFAHAGVGSGSHLCGIMLMQALNFKANFVAYRGTGPALNDVVAGQVDFLCDQTTNTFPQIEAKKIKPFAITSPERNPRFPDIATTKELGLPSLDTTVWHALYAPKGAPADIQGKVSAALESALQDKVVQERFEQLGTLLFPANARGPQAHREKLNAELKRLSDLAQSAGLSAQ